MQLSAFERAIIWQIYRATLSSVGYYTSRTRHVPSNEDKCSIVPTEINYLRLLRERKKKKRKTRLVPFALLLVRSEKKILLHTSLLLEPEWKQICASRIHQKKKNKRIGTIVRRKKNEAKLAEDCKISE